MIFFKLLRINDPEIICKFFVITVFEKFSAFNCF